MLYAIAGTITTEKDGWTCSRQIPTFFLDSDIQGIVDAEHAEWIAEGIVDPYGEYEVSLSVEPVLPSPKDA